ncbi:MAG: S-layer homology domain-containing protein, partial [Fenollaria timonensis]
PDTSKEGYTTAKIQVVYNDGKTEELIVLVKVLPDYVEQTDPDDPTTKPDVPDNFVKVIVKTKEKVVKEDGTQEEVERATEDTKFEKTFWVNPSKEVTIDVNKPTGIKDITDNRTWNFDYWKVDADDGAEYRNTITDQFTKETTILAKYTKDEVEKPSADDVITEEGVQPSKNDYLDKIDAPDGKTINDIKIIKEPDVSRPGVSTAIIEVEYNDGTKALVDVKVFVQRKNEPQPQPSEPQIIYRDRIVEKEKIVEKIVKIKDNERLKELRYMQGYNGKFRPYDGLRRSEAAQILANALKADGYAYDPYYPISYTDIGDTWYTEAVRIVSQAGVFQGYSDGTFKPEGKITRAEWVATLRRFQDLKKVSGNDMGLSIGHWATEEIEAAYQAGWLDVYTSGKATFDANAPITRQEVAAVSNKAFDRVLDKVYLQRNVKNMINYKDINPSMPLYEDILCASNTLLTDGRYYKANTIILDNLTFNIVTDDLLIYQKKFQYNVNR